MITKSDLKDLFQKYRIEMFFKTPEKKYIFKEDQHQEDPRQHSISYSRVNLRILILCFLCVLTFIYRIISQKDFNFGYMYFYFIILFYKLSYGFLKNSVF